MSRVERPLKYLCRESGIRINTFPIAIRKREERPLKVRRFHLAVPRLWHHIRRIIYEFALCLPHMHIFISTHIYPTFLHKENGIPRVVPTVSVSILKPIRNVYFWVTEHVTPSECIFWGTAKNRRSLISIKLRIIFRVAGVP